MAHPKVRRTNTRIKFTHGKPPPVFPKPHLETLVSHRKATTARDDLKALVDQIHAAAKTKFPQINLEQDALGGIVGRRTTSIERPRQP